MCKVKRQKNNYFFFIIKFTASLQASALNACLGMVFLPHTTLQVVEHCQDLADDCFA
jgi:hypothetical protein